ncbi:protein YgfX [Pistricoccus aurantiacus]|uniref:protein YgfX n=1 Tax=Pistricoccus aurantiacus TaxID=1883414 RepID=UPI00363C468B
MRKPPITINIVPSNLAEACHVLLGVGVLGLVGLFGPSWLVLVTLSGSAAVFIRCRKRKRYSLRWLASDKAIGQQREGQWQWRCDESPTWRAVSVRVAYLGPWLIGLDVDRQRCWLWPDSATGETLRKLRRHLLTQNELMHDDGFKY